MKELKKKYYELYKKELFESCVPFWLKYGRDGTNGGVYTCLDRYGRIFSTDKGVWMQGRCGWTFSKLVNLFGGNADYLAFAKECIDFENAHCFDEDGRMFFKVTADGRPVRKRRYWFSESFYVIACAEYYKATGDKKYLDDAKRVYDMIYGIFTDGESDPFRIFPKVYPETRRMKGLADCMILLNVSSIMREADGGAERYTANIDVCLAEIKKHYFPDLHALLENISVDGEYIGDVSEGRFINPGHDLECAYFLAEEANYRGDKALMDFAEVIFADAIERGWDKEYGGIFYFKDAENFPVEAYEHDMKLWWTHNEAINAAIKLYEYTGREMYKQWFEKLTEYTFAHFSDKEYGEWYGYLRRDGAPTEPACKGCTYKGPFHVERCLATVLSTLEKY